MQKTSEINFSTYLKKYWFQLSLICIAFYIVTSKDLSFQFNINNPKIENSNDWPDKVQQEGDKETERYTQNKSKLEIAKGEAGFFKSTPFIGRGNNQSGKKSEFPKIDEYVVESYLKRFSNVAINERKKYGVPSSIILANALFHSYAGKRDMTRSGNNHFGIPCSDDWNGENGTYLGTCYRHYENAWMSFRDHSLYVTSGNFEKLKQLGTKDYKGWAKNLEAVGYSEFEDLEKNLISIIEQYNLDLLDTK